jgi:hypothetical protein
VGLLWEFDLLVAFDATKSYNNGIKPGGAFCTVEKGSVPFFPGSGRQWCSLAQWRFCTSYAVRLDNRNGIILCDGLILDR